MKKITGLLMSALVGLTAMAQVNPTDRATVRDSRVSDGVKAAAIPTASQIRTKNSGVPGLYESGVATLKGNMARKNLPKANVTTDNIFAGMCYPDYALYTMDHEGNYTTFVNGFIHQVSAMGVKDGKLKVLAYDHSIFGAYGAYYEVYDLETGYMESQTNLFDVFLEGYIQCGAYVPEDDAFYGFSSENWVRFDCESKSYEILKEYSAEELANLYAGTMTYNVTDRYLVGFMTKTGDIRKYNKEDGTFELIGTATDAISEYIGGFAYDANSGNYIYNPNTDSESHLVSIDTKTLEVSVIKEYTKGEEFSAFYVNESKPVDSEGPKAGKLVSSSFELGALTGTVTFQMPSELNNGTSCAGEELEYKLYVNSLEYKSGKANGGELKVFSIGQDAGLANGVAVFKLVCWSDGHEGADGIDQLYVGKDTPLAPQNVTLTFNKVSWDPVTEGAHGGYVNPQEVTYNVYINGKTVAENLSATSCGTNLPANTELTLYTAEVYAMFGPMVSKPGKSNQIRFGEALPVPCSFLPTEEEIGLFTTLDANNDGSEWAWSASSGAFRYHLSVINPGDDWLFLPPMNFEDAKNFYTFSLDAWAQFAFYAEKFEVKVGKEPTPEAMTVDVIAPTVVNYGQNAKQTSEGMFSVPEPGKYYIGIHAISDPDAYNLFVNNFDVKKTNIAFDGPGAITDIKTEAGKDGALEATVEFKLPTVDNKGQQLDATKDVSATFESLVDLQTVTGKPGTQHKVKLSTIQGDNEIAAQTSLDGNLGMLVTVPVYTGFDYPGIVTNIHFEMNEDNISGTLKWDAPVKGAYDGYIERTGIKYYLCQPVETIFGTQWQLAGEIGTDVYELPFSVAEQSQNPLKLGVVAENVAGMAPYLGTAIVSAGTPWSIPAFENWKDGINYPAVVTASPEFDGSNPIKQVSWGFSDALTGDMAADGKDAVVAQAYSDTYGELTLPTFSTLNQNKVAFIPEIFVGACKNVKILARSYDIELTELLDLDAVIGMDRNEYQQIQINLPAKFQNKNWIQIVVRPYFTAEKNKFVMLNYKLRDMVNNDLRVAVAGARETVIGESVQYTATVTNVGLMSSVYTGGTFKAIDKNGNVIAEKTVTANKEMASDEELVTEVFEFTPTVENVGEVTVSFTLASTDDNAANNIGTLAVNVVKGSAVVVDDLRGEAVSEGKVNLEWTEAEFHDGVESFEEMDPFVLSGDEIGQFTQVVNRNKTVYTWAGNDYLINLTANVRGQAGFNVYDGPQLDTAFGQSGLWTPSDGDRFLIVFCPDDASKADDWLISPAVEGGSEFSFDARPLISKYGKETVEICYSTVDGTDPKDFKVLETVEIGSDDVTADPEWETVTATLPKDAKRFAIHYISQDIFGLSIDNIKWTPAGGAVKVAKYEVYRQCEGENTGFKLIGEATSDSFIDETAVTTYANDYYVVPVLSNGKKGLQSNIAVVKAYVSGIADLLGAQAIVADKGTIVIRGFEGEKVAITTADGKVVATGIAKEETRVEVTPGVYIVKAGKRVAKLIVR